MADDPKKRGFFNSISKQLRPKTDEPKVEDDIAVLPNRPSNDQMEELFRVTIDMIIDANRIYHTKTSTMHRKIFELEELFRAYTSIKDQLQGNLSDPEYKKEKNKQTKTKELEMNLEIVDGCEAPIDIDSLTSIEEAKQAYSQLLMDYLEHQSVLDTIIGMKEAKIKELEAELIVLGWTNDQNKRKTSPEMGKKKKKRTRDVIFKFRGGRPKSSSPVFPEGPTVSKLVSTNKDILPTKRVSHAGTVTRDDFEIISVIGKGAFGKVYLVVKKQTGQLMAMKVMEKSSILEDGDDSLRHVIHELEFMRDMSHHPFIVSLYHAFQTDHEVSLVMEWVGGGTLFDYLVKLDEPFSEDEARFFSAQVLIALQSLHANDIVYRDLKLENILLDEDGYIRLSDFGLSARAKRGERIHSFSGTATYLAPEIIRDTGEDGHTHCVDIWCFGVMLFIMLTQEPPFWAEHYPDLFHLIKTTEVPFHYYSYLSPFALSLLKGLLEKDPNHRLGCGPRGIADIQDHPFFSTIDWKALIAKKLPVPFKPLINRGKKETEEPPSRPKGSHVPAEIFKGFSFVWNPSEAAEFLDESIGVLCKPEDNSNRASKLIRKVKKNRVVVNFFLWIKEIQGLSANFIGAPVYIKWKHDMKKYLTIIGPDAEEHVDNQTLPIICGADRSASFSGSMDNACIACDYVMLQDRKALKFDSRPIVFLLCSDDKKRSKSNIIGRATVDLCDFSFHKLEKTQIFSFVDAGCTTGTMVVSILCSWKSFNGDVVDNYESQRLKNVSPNSAE